MNEPLSLTEQSVCHKVRMSPDENSKVHNSLWSLQSQVGRRGGRNYPREAGCCSYKEGDGKTRLAIKWKMTGSCSSISRCLSWPQAFAVFTRWHPQHALSNDAPLTASSPESSEGALLNASGGPSSSPSGVEPGYLGSRTESTNFCCLSQSAGGEQLLPLEHIFSLSSSPFSSYRRTLIRLLSSLYD